jgi:SAM-dependent MidA family methyltransferase
MTTPLGSLIAKMIAEDGPMGLDRYMQLCLGHGEHGYYMSRDPFGARGDFTTAPEVSQIFGELIGIWCVSTWQIMQAPDPVRVIEIGPGRGTLMSDLLRAARVMPGFADSVKVHLVETSPVLRAIQKETLSGTKAEINWHDDVTDVPAGPALVVGNEFFDALPVRQLQLTGDGWHERVVGLDDERKLQIGLARDTIPAGSLPDWVKPAETGDIVELAPVRDAYAQKVADRISRDGGAALFVDYGHVRSGTGDTLQAVRRHEYVDILHEPGHCDLTAHVDFAALAAVFALSGLKVFGPVTQSRFLAGMGLAERVEMLSKRGGARERMKVADGARRLVAGTEMGHLFKVIVATDAGMATPVPFAQMEDTGSR